jgi:hypothetical protein
MRKLRFAGAGVATAILLVASGCGDNSGNPTGFFPVGTPGEAWLFTVAQPPTPEDSTQVLLFANVLSPPPANGFRLYLNPAEEGYRPASPAAVPPVSTTGAGYSSYLTLVEGFDPAVGGTVIARGARDGYETALAPTTNTSTIVPSPPLELLRRQAVTHVTPLDSTAVHTANPTLTWEALGTATYLLTVTTATGFPVYVAHVTSNSHQVGIGPGVIFENQPIREGLYFWHLQALDGGYRVFGVSNPPSAFFVDLPDPD